MTRSEQNDTRETELAMGVSNVADFKNKRIINSQRILELRRGGWERENINFHDASMFCSCELRLYFRWLATAL